MAENTYKAKSKKEKKSSKSKTKSPGKNFSLSISFLSDPRFKLVVGLFLLLFSISLLASFFSYLITGKEDQSIVESRWVGSVVEEGQNVKNIMGLIGAQLSYVFIFKWFGIASFLFIPILAITGYKIVFKKEVPFLPSLIKASLFLIFWISVGMGSIVASSSRKIELEFLCGGIGYEIAAYLQGLSGWGTSLFLMLVLGIFAIYFFDIKNLSWLSGKRNESVSGGEQTENEASSAEGTEFAEEVSKMKEEFEQEVSSTEQPSTESIEQPTETESELTFEVPEVKKKAPVSEPSFEVANVEEEPALETESVENSQNTDEEENLGLEVDKGIEEKESRKDVTENYDPTLDLAHYKFPSVDLLNDHSGNKVQVSREELEQNKNRIVETLGNYKIGIQSIKATIGPTVTLYEIVPEAGVKISKIKNLEDDIALSLAALGIRIIAPIPGKGTIGIEVPNKNRELVSIRSSFSTEKFVKSEMALPIVFGKTISNEVFMIDLSKMPHLLMAGATGQGKSVGINVILASLLYKKHPSQLKFVLVDPKKVELSIFSKIEQHFLAKLPDSEDAIITDTKKVVHTLNSLCIEMDTRYDLLKDASCRNLKEYNKKFVERKLNPTKGHRYMPYIVVVIDELADLMMTAGKEVETPIARLAQLARAIGIHLVIATQRPSVNVITGIIKANFPARISFRVTSKVDSRTILDAGGADQLVGMGDMLFSQGSDLTRVQCAFIDTPEVENLVDFIGDQQGYPSAFYLPEYIDENAETLDVDLSDRDSMFEDAARLLVIHQQGSTSLIQRKLKLGYNRAGRIIDQLEAAGIVGPFEGSKAREVLIADEMSLEQLLRDLG